MPLLTTDQSNTSLHAASWTLLVMSIANVLTSLLLLLLIHYMFGKKMIKMNLWTKMVVIMTTCVLIYDACFFLDPYALTKQTGTPANIAWIFILGVSSMGSGTWCLSIVAAIWWVTRDHLNPLSRTKRDELFSSLLVWNVAAGLGVGVYMALVDTAAAFDLLGLVLMAVTSTAVVGILLLLVKANWMGEISALSPLHYLLSRYCYYPIGGFLCRIGSEPYNRAYGPIYLFPKDASGAQTFWLFIFCILLPSQGITDFLVFIFTRRGKKGLKALMVGKRQERIAAAAAAINPKKATNTNEAMSTPGGKYETNQQFLERLCLMDEDDAIDECSAKYKLAGAQSISGLDVTKSASIRARSIGS